MIVTGIDKSSTMVWITNPLTIPFFFYFTYRLGSWLGGYPARQVEFEPSLGWMLTELGDLWQPLLLGCLTTGLVAAALGYALVKLVWRWWVWRTWSRRRATGRDRKRGHGSAVTSSGDDRPSGSEHGPFEPPDPGRG